MRRSIVWTSQFKKDYKLAMKRHLNMDLLDDAIRTLYYSLIKYSINASRINCFRKGGGRRWAVAQQGRQRILGQFRPKQNGCFN